MGHCCPTKRAGNGCGLACLLGDRVQLCVSTVREDKATAHVQAWKTFHFAVNYGSIPQTMHEHNYVCVQMYFKPEMYIIIQTFVHRCVYNMVTNTKKLGGCIPCLMR